MKKDKLQCKVAKAADNDYIQTVSEKVLDAYTGGLHQWEFIDSPTLWKIHVGARAIVLGVEINGKRCCVKLFYDNRAFVLTRNILGLSKAGRAYRNGLQLAETGLDCPEILGFSVSLKKGLALLVTELIDDAEQVDHWLERNGADAEFLESLGCFVVRMHKLGVLHKDLSPRNLLIKISNGDHLFIILDYEDLSFHRKISKKKRMLNLQHLHVRLMRTLPENKLDAFLKGCGQEKL
jgi:tRNA A-37 threonylcarbamoyl transferase component Bud32